MSSIPTDPDRLRGSEGLLAQRTFGPATRRRLRQLRTVVFVGAITIAGLLYFTRSPYIPWTQGALGALIIVFGIVPSAVYLGDNHAPPIPLVPLTGWFYATALGASLFFDGAPLTSASLSQVSTDALEAVLCGLSAFYFGYYAFASTLLRAARPFRVPRDSNTPRLRFALWGLLAVHLAGLLFRSVARDLYLTEFIDPVGYTAYGMLFVCWIRQYLPPWHAAALVGITVVEALLRLATGSLAQIMSLALFLLVVFWTERRKVPWSAVAVGLVLFGIFNYSKAEYRELTWANGPYANASSFEKLKLFVRVSLDKVMSEDAGQTNSKATTLLVSRVSQLGFLSYVMDQTPSSVPYWHGATYLPLFYKLIPRMFWANKPIERLGIELTQRYQMRGLADDVTSFNVPWIVEMFANFGWLGVIGGMFAVGILFAYAESKLNRSDLSTLELVIGATVLFELVYQETNFSLMVGGKLPLVACLYLYFHLMLKPKAKGSQLHVNRFGESLTA